VLNGLFVAAVLLSVAVAAFTGRMEGLTRGVLESAGNAVTLALGLVGAMAFFLGLMRVASDGGLLKIVARAVAPVMRRLFPGVPADHPAMSAMILNIASNMLGLANAATPFGIRAMMELDRLNPKKGRATDAMVLFLAINTSGLALLPTGVIALRAAAGSQDPAGIFFTTWFASGCATIVGITAAILLSRLPRYRIAEEESAAPAGEDHEPPEVDGKAEPLRPPRWAAVLAVLYGAVLVAALTVHGIRESGTTPFGDITRGVLSYWTLPALIAGLVLFGWARGVRVYDSLVEGAREGFQVAIRIIPYLVAILVAVGMVRASGVLEAFVAAVGPVTARVGLPAEALPMAILRPLSGSGAYGVMAEIMSARGPDSYVGYLVSTLQGSTETTFYVLAVYFGAVGIRKTRHALPACLAADLAGIAAAVFVVWWMFG
jgi:spore maturation protein SpmA